MDARAKTERTRSPVYLAAALLLCAVIYGPSFGGEFVWDDTVLVRDNPTLQGLAGLKRLLVEDLWGGAGAQPSQLYHPVPQATLWLQTALTGRSIIGYQVGNLGLHFACGALFFAWLRARGLRTAIAALAMFGFLVHPSAIEPARWLTGRHDTLGVAFVLSALVVIARRDLTLSLRAALVAACCALSVLCKEAFVVAPLWVALVVLDDVASSRAERRELGLVVLPGALAVLLVFVLRARLQIASGSAMTSAPILELVRHYGTIVAHYAAQIGALRDGRTTERYLPLSIGVALAVVCAAVVVVASLASFARRDRRVSSVLLSVSLFLVALSPLVLSVPLIGMWGNRYAYLPMIGLLAAAAHGASLAPRRFARGLAVVAALAVALGALFSAVRARDFRSELALFGADYAEAPDDPRAAYHYGTAVFAQGGCGEALPLYVRAVRADPSFARAWRNVAGCSLNVGRFEEAAAAARTGRTLEPRSPVHAYHLGAALLALGDTAGGRAALRDALALDPGYEPARRLLATSGAAP